MFIKGIIKNKLKQIPDSVFKSGSILDCIGIGWFPFMYGFMFITQNIYADRKMANICHLL